MEEDDDHDMHEEEEMKPILVLPLSDPLHSEQHQELRDMCLIKQVEKLGSGELIPSANFYQTMHIIWADYVSNISDIINIVYLRDRGV